MGEYLDDRALPAYAYVFADQGEFFVFKMFARRQWKAECRAAGFTENPPRVYDLRLALASLRAKEGVPPHVLKEWMGHTSIKTAPDVYSHVYEGDPRMVELVERLYSAPAATPSPLASASDR